MSKYISENYINLTLLEAARWKKEMEHMKQKDADRLVKAGVPKPKEEWLKGMEKGSKKLLKKSNLKKGGYKEHPKKTSDTSYHTTQHHGGKSTIHIGTKNATDVDKATAKRHEVDEAVTSNKMRKRYKLGGRTMKTIPGLSVYRTNKSIVEKNNKKKEENRIGTHASPRVLKHEKQYLPIAAKIYKDPESKSILKDRQKGEYGITKKEFGTAKRMRNTEKGIANAHKKDDEASVSIRGYSNKALKKKK